MRCAARCTLPGSVNDAEASAVGEWKVAVALPLLATMGTVPGLTGDRGPPRCRGNAGAGGGDGRKAPTAQDIQASADADAESSSLALDERSDVGVVQPRTRSAPSADARHPPMRVPPRAILRWATARVVPILLVQLSIAARA